MDPDGYLMLAKHIANGGPLAVKENDPFMYQSHVWVENSDGEVAPKFAPGYPVLLAIAYLLGGDDAMFLVSPVMGLLMLVGAYFLFRLWMSRLAALAAVFCLATNAMVLVYSGYLLTHASNACFAVWGMFFLWRWVRGSGRIPAAVAGLLLGTAVTMRHTSILLGIVVFAAIVVRWRRARPGQGYSRPLVAEAMLLLGAYGFVLLLLGLYDWFIFGSPFTSGYALSGEQYALSLRNIPNHLRTLLKGLNFEGLFLSFPIGLVGLLLAGPTGESLMRVLWFAPLCLFYAAYYWAPGGAAYYRSHCDLPGFGRLWICFN